MKNIPNSIGLNYKNKRCQSGLSLIELLIAMFIGLFLLVGVTTSYLASKKTSILRDQISTLEDNGQIALEILTNTLQHTGYSSFTGGALDKKFVMERADVENTTCGVSSVLGIDNFPETGITQDGIGNGADSIGMVFLGDNNVFTDCTGQALPATCRVGSGSATNSAKIYNAFFVDDSNNLRCAGSRNELSPIIAEGIENIQILYGVDTNSDSLVDSYLNATKVNSVGIDGLWAEVVSIQLSVLARSSVEVKSTPEAKTFSLLDNAYTVPVADRYERAVFNTTISLRNSIN